MIPDIREVDRPEVGRFYMVPSVVATKLAFGTVVLPVYGPLHEDAEFIKFEWHHWHIDWRFVKAAFYRYRLGWHRGDERRLHAMPINQNNTDGTAPTLRRFKMLREMPPYVEPQKLFWLADLENAYANHRLTGKCLTCPHRGVPLRNILPNEKGEVTCPAHGLTWDIATGKLVRKAPGTQQIVFPFATRGTAQPLP